MRSKLKIHLIGLAVALGAVSAGYAVGDSPQASPQANMSIQQVSAEADDADQRLVADTETSL